MTNDARKYLITALWSSGDGDLENLDEKYGPDDVASGAVYRAEKDLTAFIEKCYQRNLGESLGDNWQHDFWLTRNGHGAGFWDGDYEEEICEALTEIAKSFPEMTPYIGDDGKIYIAQ